MLTLSQRYPSAFTVTPPSPTDDNLDWLMSSTLKKATQEVAEMLRQALAEYRTGGPERDEKSYVLTAHGTRLRLVGAYFTEGYLRPVQSSSLPTNQHLYVRRSKFYELRCLEYRVATLGLSY